MIRTLKICAALVIGLMGSLFFLNNLFNLDTAHSVVTAVVSGQEQPYYKIMGPTATAPWLTWLALATIMAGELAVGACGLIGTLKMFLKRSASAGEFQRSKSLAIAAGAGGMLVWYGLFVTVGESYFNMWQTTVGAGSVEGAFRYGTVCMALMFFLRTREDD